VHATLTLVVNISAASLLYSCLKCGKNFFPPQGENKKNGPPTLKIHPILDHFYSIFYYFDSHCVLPHDTKQLTYDLFCQKFQKLLGIFVKIGINLSGMGSIFLFAPCKFVGVLALLLQKSLARQAGWSDHYVRSIICFCCCFKNERV